MAARTRLHTQTHAHYARIFQPLDTAHKRYYAQPTTPDTHTQCLFSYITHMQMVENATLRRKKLVEHALVVWKEPL